MLEFIKENIQLITTISIALFATLFIICIIKKFVRLAIGLAVMTVLIPILFTVFWGDGTEYVHEFASVFAEPHRQNIEEFYEEFKERDREAPVIDYGAVSEKATHVFETAKHEADKLLGSGGSE